MLKGILPTVTVILIVLKLLGLFPYSWWWVFSPMLLGFGAIIVIMIVAAIVGVVTAAKK